MNPVRWLERRARGEDGIAMVVAVILSSVVATLAALLLTVGIHTDQASARGRHYVQSLHVAESGIEHALAKLEAAGGSLSTQTYSGSTDLGEYDVTITRQPRNRYVIEASGGVRQGRALGAERVVRVQVEPPLSFDKALFSFTTVETKNGDRIEGDVWANHSVVLASGTVVTGSVVGATGYVRLENSAHVYEDIWSGGFNPATRRAITLFNNARLDGNAKASVVHVNCVGADNADYKVLVDSGAVIAGNSQSWGSVTGGGSVLGTISNNSCTAAPPTEQLPSFSYSASTYDAATLHEFGAPGAPSATAVDEFHTYVAAQGKRIAGTFYINQETPVNQDTRLDLTGVVITADTTIVTNTPVFANGIADDATDAIFTLVSTYQPPAGTTCDVNHDNSECAVHLKNNFATTGATASLIYSPYGPTAIKNNAEHFGVVYADSIQIKNNQTLTYDERVARVVGFGPVTYEITRWEELAI